jgi:hypothetical protein
VEFSAKFPDVPQGVPCYAVCDVSSLLFKHQSYNKPTGLKVKEVKFQNKQVSFEVYKILEYKEPFSPADKARLVILADSPGPGEKGEFAVTLKKKGTEYFRK